MHDARDVLVPRAKPWTPRALAWVLAALALASLSCDAERSPVVPPNPDVSSYPPAVATSLREGREAVLRAPDQADAWGRFGEVLMAHNRFEDAVRCFREAHRLDPGAFRWPYLAGNTLMLLDGEEALRMFELARDLDPSYVATHLRVGRMLLTAGRRVEAEQAFGQALELHPGDSHALFGLALAALSVNDLERAREQLERALRSRPDHREVHATLARVYASLGLDEQARAAAARGAVHADETPLDDPVLEEVIAHGSSSVHLAMRGQELLEQGQLDEAIEVLRLAHRDRPDYLDVRVNLASALILRGDEQEGIAMLQAAEREAPGNVDAAAMIEQLRRQRSR